MLACSWTHTAKRCSDITQRFCLGPAINRVPWGPRKLNIALSITETSRASGRKRSHFVRDIICGVLTRQVGTWSDPASLVLQWHVEAVRAAVRRRGTVTLAGSRLPCPRSARHRACTPRAPTAPAAVDRCGCKTKEAPGYVQATPLLWTWRSKQNLDVSWKNNYWCIVYYWAIMSAFIMNYACTLLVFLLVLFS